MSSLRYNDKAVITPESSNSTTAEVGESAIKQDLSIKKHNDSISSNDHVDGDIQKCPCCNNPWSSATGDIFALLCQTCKSDKDSDEGVDDSTKKSTKQQQQKVLLQSGEESNSSNESKGISRDNMDFSVKPYDNFFRYANGGWMDKNPIPAEYPSWNTFMQLRLQSQERLRDILDNLLADEEGQDMGKVTSEKNSKSTEQEDDEEERAKLKAFYNASMNESKIEADNILPLQHVLDLCLETAKSTNTNIPSNSELASFLGTLKSKYGISAFFSIGASPDNKDSEHSLCQIYQGGLGLPDRDYYFDEDKADKREKYKIHMANMLYLLDHPTTTTATDSSLLDEISDEEMKPYVEMAEGVYMVEIKLAEAHMTKTENRDPEATYNKMSVANLSSEWGKGMFDFSSYLNAALGNIKTVADLGDINVRNTAAMTRVAEVVSNLDSDTLTNYLRWHTVHNFAKYMNSAFVNEDFQFFEKTLSGSQELKPRWKRAMDFIESALGEALGKLYCNLHFDSSCKERALDIVEAVRQSLEERLKEVDWMTSDDTRRAALDKMSNFKVKIGFPDKWIDYTSLGIKSDQSFLQMAISSSAFHHARIVREMNAPTDRKKWFMTPQTVNAYYHPSLNEIVFPAAILQSPFFDADADDPVNFGSMGAVVGHEMTHGFDDKGRKFNADGNMLDWWTKADGEEYERRVEVMVNQANAYDVHGLKVQGKLTCGENIADLGGLRLAMRALQSRSGFDDSVDVDGFTPLQRFFLGWAQCWRQNITKERALQLLTLDPHGPNEMRCNGPLSNMNEFHKAFGVPEESAMYKSRDQRVDIW